MIGTENGRRSEELTLSNSLTLTALVELLEEKVVVVPEKVMDGMSVIRDGKQTTGHFHGTNRLVGHLETGNTCEEATLQARGATRRS